MSDEDQDDGDELAADIGENEIEQHRAQLRELLSAVQNIQRGIDSIRHDHLSRRMHTRHNVMERL